MLASAENVDIAETDIPALLQFAQEKESDLTLVGSEVILLNGIVDIFQAEGLKIFGPSKAGAKSFAKAFRQKHNIPTATYETFQDYDLANQFLHQATNNWDIGAIVVKADGLAEGKGVVVCETLKQAEAALMHIMVQRAFGSAGDSVVVE